MLQRTHRIAANGLTHFVRDSGSESAPAALLLHGFPDSSAVWSRVTAPLVAAGYRLLAPDLRGFAETGIPARTEDYDIQTGAVVDILGIMDALHLERVHLVGHDFGAPMAWALAAQHADRFNSLAALSVGHPAAYLKSGLEQKFRSLYIVYHQFQGLCEATYRFNNWSLLRRQWRDLADTDEAIRLLARPGRLTAGLNWYRANLSFRRMIGGTPLPLVGDGRIRIPTLGIWSSREKYLVEAQMTGSAQHVDAPWTYERIEGAGHWIPVDAPDALAALLIRHWRAS